MVGVLFALFIQGNAKKTPIPPDFSNAQLTVHYLREELYTGTPRYGSNTDPYLITQTFEPYKGPPTFDPGDTPPLTFTLEKLGKGGWKFTDKSDSQTMEVVADDKVAIPFQRWDYRGFTALNAKTGAKLWTRMPVGKGNRACIALIAGVLYQWDAGDLSASNPYTGDAIWNEKIEAKSKDVEIPPIQVKNGRLFIELEVKGKDVLYCINAQTGQLIWNQPIGDSRSGFAVTNRRVFRYQYRPIKGSDDKSASLFSFDVASGEKVWSIPVDINSTAYTPEATDEVVFLPGCRSPSYLYRLSDGSLIKKYEMQAEKTLFGRYVLEVDDSEDLVLSLAETGERIGRVRLTKDETWQFQHVGDRLLFVSPRIRRVPNTNVVYEILATK